MIRESIRIEKNCALGGLRRPSALRVALGRHTQDLWQVGHSVHIDMTIWLSFPAPLKNPSYAQVWGCLESKFLLLLINDQAFEPNKSKRSHDIAVR